MIATLYDIFQKWSTKGAIYLVSDTHFDDVDRDFMGYTGTSQNQVDLINKYCHKNDTLIHLGDVGETRYMDQIKAHKVLILGNHDNGNTKKAFDEFFAEPIWVSPKLVLSHQPLDLTCGFEKPIAFNIHGHDHAQWSFQDEYHLNIAQNVFGYIPLNLNKVIKAGFLKNINSLHEQTVEIQKRKKANRDNNT